jgi:hypothetical protein
MGHFGLRSASTVSVWVQVLRFCLTASSLSLEKKEEEHMIWTPAS